mgnify:CR=1 FL=1
MTCAELLIRLLRDTYDVDTVFGIPGVHTIELYRGLEGGNGHDHQGSGIRHVTPRHEQGAGFMADGYARTTGKPGVCFIITGPGMTNIATAMGLYQAVTGVLVLAASLIAGALWDRYGAHAPFVFGAIMSMAAACLFLAICREERAR